MLYCLPAEKGDEDMAESFDELRHEYYESRCETAVKALEKRWFEARWFSTTDRAVRAVMDLIPAGSRIGAGGSFRRCASAHEKA